MTVTDPCETTVINDAVFSPTTLTVTNGAQAAMTFTEVTDSVEVANNIDTLCQGRTYTLLMNDGVTAADFITLSGSGPYTITAAPTLDSEVGSHTYKLKTELAAYPGNSNSPHITDIPVVVQASICDPSGLAWLSSSQVTQTIDVATGPTTVTISPYTVDATSKTATPEMRACSGVFDETYTVSAVEKG